MKHFGFCFQIPTVKVFWPLQRQGFDIGNYWTY